MLRAHNTRYPLKRWETPEGQMLTGQLPQAGQGRPFGPTLVSDLRYPHHHCPVTQPLGVEQLREGGIAISTARSDALLTAPQDSFQQEKDALWPAGVACASSRTVDDSGARHPGKNAYTPLSAMTLLPGWPAPSAKAASILCSCVGPAIRTTGSRSKPWPIGSPRSERKVWSHACAARLCR